MSVRTKTGGRKKGTQNKITAGLKAAVLGALEAKGGQLYLEQIAETHPQVFCSLLAKILPLTLGGDQNQPIIYEIVTGVSNPDTVKSR